MSRAIRCAARVAVRSAVLAATIATLPAAHAQRPTPIDRVTVIERLPMPTNVTVKQTAEGYVALSWNAVSGAKQYVLGRSIGTNGFQRVYAPLAGPTLFIDRDVPVGTRVSYTITPVDSSDIAGLRATSADFTPVAVTAPAATAPPAPPVVATLLGSEIAVHWEAVPNTERYQVMHQLNGVVVSSADVALRHDYSVPAAPGTHRFIINSKPSLFGSGTTRASNPVVVPSATQAASSDSSGTSGPIPTPSDGSSPAPGPTGTTPTTLPADYLSAGPSLTLRVGASAPVYVSGARWSSLDPNIAYANADGVVSAVAAGRARIVALVALPDGSVHALVVHVTVNP